MKKILVITYYWPPSGGAGVQRTLKFVKYLPVFNIEPIVITVDKSKASYPVLDETLENEVAKNLDIHFTNSFEPLSILASLVGKNKIPYGGFANKNKETFFQTMLRWIRGNFFIPDARVGWIKFAFKAAVKIIEEQNIDTVYISSPPHSSQLIGLKLKNKFPNIKWIADMRDPWTDIYYYNDLLHTRLAKKLDLNYEKKVLEIADQVIVVSDSIKTSFYNKSEKISPNKIHVIPNGFDGDDFNNLEGKTQDFFYITYVGTMADTYKPNVFFEAFSEVIKSGKTKIKFRFVGSIPWTVKDQAKQLGIDDHCEWIGHVDHKDAITYMKNSDLLLLIIPDSKGAEGILTGKLFEYLGSRKPILGLGPKNGNAAEIINRCSAGRMFERKEKKEILDWIVNNIEHPKNNDNPNIFDYERKNLTQKIVELIN